jgi:23S rRNA pseudouridine2604 synthase
MAQAVGYRVVALHRVRIMHVTLAGLPSGAWKPLTPPEREELLKAVGRNP